MRVKNTALIRVTASLLAGLGSVVLLLFVAKVYAQGGVAGQKYLDPGFNGTGSVTISVSGTNQIARDVAIQPDGKLIVAGYDNWGTSDNDVILARVNPNGSLDTTFGNGGVVITSFSSGNDTGYAATVQPDGKIVVAGHTQSGGNSVGLVLRYNADGTLDSGFGASGVVTTGFQSADAWFLAVDVLDDGRIVAGGTATVPPTVFMLARYQSNGTPDTTLGGTGVVTTAFPGFKAYSWDMAIQPDGKMVLAGYYYDSSNNNGGFALVRYNTDGSLDSGFGTGGVVTQSLSVTTDYAYGVNVQSDGEIVAGGLSNHTGVLARYTSDGSFDNSFGLNSSLNYITTTVSGYDLAVFIETALRANDGIVAAMRASDSGGGAVPVVGITVFDKNGIPQTEFGPNGVITTTNAGHGASDYALLVQPDGKVVLAGYVDMDDSVAYATDLTLWRYVLLTHHIYLPLVLK